MNSASVKMPSVARRAKPGSTGAGNYYHIELRPTSDFRIFRTQDVGRRGGIERVAGQRKNGAWTTQKWLIAKAPAHVEGNRLVPDNKYARQVLEKLGSVPVRLRGNRFKAAPDRRSANAKPRRASPLAQTRNQQNKSHSTKT